MNNPIYPCLWFNDNALQAAEFYTSVFPDSEILSSSPVVVTFNIKGSRFMGLNGGPQYTHSPATSFVIECKDQDEIDYYWEKLGEGGQHDRCGWLVDKFGISWQVVPEVLSSLMQDAERAGRVTEAFLKMKKFDIEKLMQA